MVTITADPPAPDPGTSALITVHIQKTNGPVGGMYLTSNRVGTFSLAGGPVRLVSPSEVTHSSPNSNGSATEVLFQVRWNAPAGQGNVTFDVSAVSGNGNNDRSGDSVGQGRLGITWGCAGVMAFVDHDGDGFGRDNEPVRVCEIGTGFAAKGGDCDDNNKEAYPGHPEICNYYDDNCDGKINEGLENAIQYRDNDGDGHGARGTTDTIKGCNGMMSGYAPVADDCNDNDSNIYPGAPEVCDGIDNNCNNKIDDGARASCGTGWCRRTASTCDPKSCTPGPPRAEQCNNFDDDCDGVIDNGPNLCEEGRVCVGGYCLSPEVAGDAGAALAHGDGGVPVASGNPVPGGGGDLDGGVYRKAQVSALGCALGGRAGGFAPLVMVTVLVLLAFAAPRRRS